MISKTYDKQRATWIYDRDGYRAIVYKVADRWHLRAGPLQPGRIAPEPEIHKDFRLRRNADQQALEYLET
ncbi:hypothetical protein KZZ05_20795 [Marinobacter adhaerens]|uniref:hypothetical protein n=1 Tax=Marinobacter adhaerens TaxID=1033846 RepID=UPI001C5E9C11|nr:hypothetical protein [Marinobacter adhaerens]MBW4980716.1 hypothetical protein [Marinobacter adhaerens]